jgi:hypothetical protein
MYPASQDDPACLTMHKQNIRDKYKVIPAPASANRITSLFLISAYNQQLNREPATQRIVKNWTLEADLIMQDCFENTDWNMFLDSSTVASRVAQQSKELHLSARDITTDPGSAGGALLDTSHQLNGVSSDTLIHLASRLSWRELISAVWQVMFRRMHESTFTSR